MEILNTFIEIARSDGFMFLLAVICIGIFLYYFKNIIPELKKIAKNQEEYKVDRKSLELLTTNYDTSLDNNTNAMQEIAKTSTNMGHSLEILNKTMENQMELQKMQHEEIKRLSNKFDGLDKRNEKIFTMVETIRDVTLKGK